MVARLEVLYQAGPSGDRIDINHSVSGSGSAIISHGTYETMDLLCSEVEFRLQTIDAQLQCSHTDGVVTISDSNGDTFSITWHHPTLQTWLGFSGTQSGAATYTGSQSPGTFIASLPWAHDQPLAWEWVLKTWANHNQAGAPGLKLARLRAWQTTIRVTRDELAQLRGVLSYMFRGQQARWYRDTTVTDVWDWSDWWGWSNVTIHPEDFGYGDEWANEQVTNHLVLPIRFLSV